MFVVTKRFGRSESRMSDFAKQSDAEKFIQEKLQEDIRFKVNATYGLYEGADLLREFSQRDAVATPAAASPVDAGSAQAAGSRSSFTPTPFNTAPRPGGIPHSWVKDEDDKSQ
jgi:hypothetical protein